MMLVSFVIMLISWISAVRGDSQGFLRLLEEQAADCSAPVMEDEFTTDHGSDTPSHCAMNPPGFPYFNCTLTGVTACKEVCVGLPVSSDSTAVTSGLICLDFSNTGMQVWRKLDGLSI